MTLTVATSLAHGQRRGRVDAGHATAEKICALG
jgi:hypothetical protein